jgi:hypothetical protein
MKIAMVAPYLMLLTFYSPQMSSLDQAVLESINDMPYHGVAVQLRGAYENRPVQEKDLDPIVMRINGNCRKHIWPWIYINRLVGYDSESSHASAKARNKDFGNTFKKIKGMDLFDENGALTDFFESWKVSLNIAKRSNSPGIVVDPEYYNNYKAGNLNYLAKQLGKSEEEIRERLEFIGTQLTDIADVQYPDAVIWFLFTSLGVHKRIEGENRYENGIAYIVNGMLNQAKHKKSKIKIISGGEKTLGYCPRSLKALDAKIVFRQGTFSRLLHSHQTLQLGGTIALWDTAESKTGYFARGACGASEVKNIKDFQPLLLKLFESYDYVWIYASAPFYNPFDPVKSLPYTELLNETLKLVKPGLTARGL